MNRRGFLGTLLGLVIAPAVIARVISEDKPKPKYKVYKDPVGNMTVGYKGYLFIEPGYIYAPYIPLYVTDKCCK